MPRGPTHTKTTINLETDTLAVIDEIASSFADYVSRGEVIDMAFSYLTQDEERLVGAFGETSESDSPEESKDGEDTQ